ncbi:MAG: uroporphyrinogen decarboxylase [SAR202 cluster bacterium]|nr:uroporphyrinogen decarboxylase [SAR202 cluster bacterium]
MTGRERLLAAARRQPVDATPVWFMRQAGSLFQDARELIQKHDIMTVAKTPELSSRVAMMPVEKLGVDGCVLFADIMLVLNGMGVPYHVVPETGPIIDRPVRSAEDIRAIRVVEPEEGSPYVLDAIRIIKNELGDRAAIVGFSGSPFTLVCYMIEGKPSRTYDRSKAFMFAHQDLWHEFMGKATDVCVRYLKGQVRAGIDVAQLFDSWVGVLSPSQYEEFVLPYSRRIFAELRSLGVPSIHFGTGNAGLLELMAAAGPDVVGVDWRVNIDEAWARVGAAKGIQGNLDPTLLLAPWSTVEREAGDVLRRVDGRPGHIYNLGHAIVGGTKTDTLQRLVDLVHNHSAVKA